MSNLFEVAREGNEDEFIRACKENIASVTMRNEDGNLLHIAAKSGILLPTVRKVISDLEREIKKAEEAKKWKESKGLKEELKRNKKYIKNALCDKSSFLFGRVAVAPLYFLDEEQRKEIKKIAGIKDSIIGTQEFRLGLYVVGAIVCTIAMCVSLYLLFSVSQSLALASIATIASGGGYMSVI
ncbi:ankyrin repeat domain-containing protein [Wolbachia endosymbiont (group B) of Gerris lacustris]|uniref:ankyrin repeat domain-containing protein n=1 Tax=Wolbachia endosymbiont (group B) of Gerris lacustris TaxID=3066159 RepID=UPI0033414794